MCGGDINTLGRLILKFYKVSYIFVGLQNGDLYFYMADKKRLLKYKIFEGNNKVLIYKIPRNLNIKVPTFSVE